MLIKRNFLACLQEETNSLRLFNVACSGLHIIKNFSQRQRLHLLDAQLYGFARFRVFHFIVKSILLRFNSQICLLSSVEFLFSYKLNDDLWLAYLVLKEFSVRPTYVSGGLLSLVETVAWYTMDSTKQLLDIGHFVFQTQWIGFFL